ncbi:hypothetical protein HU200_001435 [Digitaria exilis]|uniref:AT-hook motif nuclear-localized protein n=1 Tax=Digitaria exilis TaxID=1010633 RepID=A0A835FYG0_9POAL|nr:hypothetical protein HU200_001435 [Digitaria exilis]
METKVKREREEEGGGAAMSPSLGLPGAGGGASSAARVLLLGGAMEAPSGIYTLRAPSPFVRAMRTRIDPPPPPLAAAPTPPLPLPPPPPPPQIQEKRRRGRPRNCYRLLAPPGFLLTPPARAPLALAAPLPAMAAHGEASSDDSRHGQLGGLQPHVLKVDVGEGLIVNLTFLMSHFSLVHNLQGPLEIIQVFGSILTSDSPGFGCLSVTLSCADCTVVGGIVAGPLVAARPVQAIVGSFHDDVFRANKTPNIIARYHDSQVATGYRVTYYPNSHVATGYRVTHYPNSQVGTSFRVTDYPNSQVDTSFRITHYPSVHVASATGCTPYPSSQVAVGTGSVRCLSSEVATGCLSEHESNSQVPIGDGSTNCSSSQVTVGYGGTQHPNSQITGGTATTPCPSYQVPVGNKTTPSSRVTVGDGSTRSANSQAVVGVGAGSRHEPNSHVCVGIGCTSNTNPQANDGNGSMHEPSSHVTVGDGRTDNGNYPKSLAAVGDRSTNITDSEFALGSGSTRAGNSQGTTLVDGGTICPIYKVSVADGRPNYPNSKNTVGDGSSTSTEGCNPLHASCPAVEQGELSEIDVKPSEVVA